MIHIFTECVDQTLNVTGIQEQYAQPITVNPGEPSKQVFLEAHRQGDTQSTLEYLRFLQAQLPGKRLVILWDGASYHRAKEIRSFLAEVNEGLAPDEWRIHCIQFAPNDPRQNPIEDVWLRGKNWLRRMSGLKPCFKAMKAIFEDFFKLEVFDFPKLHQYGPHSQIK